MSTELNREAEPLASIATDARFMELAGAVAAAVDGSSVKAAITLLAQHVDGQLGRQHQAIQTLMRLNTHLAEIAASAPPRLLAIDWSTDYLTEQRAAMRDAAAELVEQAQDGGMRMVTAAAIRALDPRPVMKQGSIDRAKTVLADANLEGARPRLGQLAPAKMVGGQLVATEDLAGAVWNGPNTASQVSAAMALPSRTAAEWGASARLTPEHKGAQRQLTAAGRAMLVNAAAAFPPPPEAKHTPMLETPRGYDYIQASCSCGWKGIKRDPITQTGQYDAARDETARHIREADQARKES